MPAPGRGPAGPLRQRQREGELRHPVRTGHGDVCPTRLHAGQGPLFSSSGQINCPCGKALAFGQTACGGLRRIPAPQGRENILPAGPLRQRQREGELRHPVRTGHGDVCPTRLHAGQGPLFSSSGQINCPCGKALAFGQTACGGLRRIPAPQGRENILPAGPLRQRQREGELRHPVRTGHGDVFVVVVEDSLDNIEPQAHALPVHAS